MVAEADWLAAVEQMKKMRLADAAAEAAKAERDADDAAVERQPKRTRLAGDGQQPKRMRLAAALGEAQRPHWFAMLVCHDDDELFSLSLLQDRNRSRRSFLCGEKWGGREIRGRSASASASPCLQQRRETRGMSAWLSNTVAK